MLLIGETDTVSLFFSPRLPNSFLLAGRVLLIFLFLGFIIQGQWSIGRAFVSLLGLVACVMVAVGFKAKWSAAFLVTVLSIFNVIANNFWAVHSAHPKRDFLKYDFFQTLCTSRTLKIFHESRTDSNDSYRRRPLTSREHGPWRLVRGREEKGVLSIVYKGRRPEVGYL